MDLENLYKYSSFLSKYNYLNKSYEVSNIDLKQILNHYKNNIQKYYAISDCLVVLSSFGEGFSNALSEGLLSNLPAIVSDVGDNKRLINKNCIVTNPNDTQAIFTSIKKMISRLENIDIKEINNSREMIIENFNIKIMLNKYFNLYNDLIIH